MMQLLSTGYHGDRSDGVPALAPLGLEDVLTFQDGVGQLRQTE
jgi:hypothetical protein